MVLRRCTKRLSYGLGGFVLLFVLVHTPPAKELARHFVARIASTRLGGPAEIAGLDYRLWRGEVELTGVSLAPNVAALPFAFTAERIVARVSPGLKLSVELERPELVLVDFFEIKATDYPPILASLRRLRAVDGGIRFQNHDAGGKLFEWLRAEDVSIDILDAGEEHRIGLHARRGRVFEKRFGATDADLLLKPGTLRVASFSAVAGDSFARLEGELSFAGEVDGSFDLDFALDGKLARLVDESLDFRGAVTGDGRLRLDDGAPSLDVRLGSEELAWEHVALENLSAEALFADGTLRIPRLRVEGFGGQVELGAEISFGEDSRNRFELSWSGIDATEAVRSIAGKTLPFASRLGGTASLTLSGFVLEEPSGEARVLLEPGSDVLGTVEVSLDSGILAASSRRLTFADLEASLGFEGSLTTTTGELDVTYDARLEDVRDLLPVCSKGAISAQGFVRGTLEEPRWTARLGSHVLTIEGESYRLSGLLAGTPTGVTTEGVVLEGDRGRVTARGVIPTNADASWNVVATIEGLSLPRDTVADGDVAIFGPARDPDGTASLRLTPPTGAVSLSVRKRAREVRLEELTGSLGSGTLNAKGRYGLDDGGVEADVSLLDFRPSAIPVASAHLHGFDGVLTLDAHARGEWPSPDGTAQLRMSDVSFHDAPLPSLTFDLEAGAGELRVEGRSDDGTPLLRATVLLDEDYPVHAEVPLAAVPLGALVDSLSLSTRRERAAWSMEGMATLDGHLLRPSELEFRAGVDSLSARFDAATARADAFVIAGNAERVRVSGFDLRGEHNHLSIEGFVPLSQTSTFDLTVDGALGLGFLETLVPDLETDGNARVDLTVGGALASPDIEGEILVIGGNGRFSDVAWDHLALTARASEGSLRAIVLETEVLGGKLSIEGSVPGDVELRVEDIDLSSFVKRSGSAKVSLTGTMDVPGFDPGALSGTGRIERFALRGEGGPIELKTPSPWTLEDGTLSMPRLRLVGGESHLDLSVGSLGLDGRLFDATATGTLDAVLVNSFLDVPGMRVEGALQVALAAAKRDDTLTVSGHGSLTGGRFVMADPPFALSGVEARFDVRDSQLTLQELSGRAGGGTFLAGGTVDLRDLSRPVLDVEATVESVPLELMDGLRAEINGELRLGSLDGALRLSGNLALERGLLTRELDQDDASFGAQSILFTDETLRARPFDGLALDVVISSAQKVRVENSTADLEATGAISIGGTVSSPELGGFVTLVPDGTFNVGRNRFQVLQGRLDLTGFPTVPPNLELAAITKVGTTVIHLDVEGDTDDMRTRLSAPEDPDLTEGDLASLLVTGRTLEQAGEGGQQIASTWMMSSLANLVHEGLGDLISFGPPPGAGPLILAEEADPTARLTLGVPVTDRMSITYSIALDDSERRLWIFDYRIARNVWLRGIQENANEYSLGLSQRLSLDFRRRVRSRGAAKKQIIASVTFSGIDEGLSNEVNLRPEKRYDYWKARDEAKKLEKALIDHGYPSAVVDVETKVEQGDTRDDVALRFVANKGVRTELSWRGDDPGRDVKKRLERAWNGRYPEELLLAELAGQVRSQLRAERYYLAEVEVSVERRDEMRSVVFDVRRGPRGREVRLEFEGNDALSDRELAEALPAADTPELFLLLDRTSELERGIRLRYAAEGYLNASIGALETRYDPGTKIFHVLIPIHEGSLTRVASIEFPGKLAFDEEKLLRALRISPGTPVDFPQIRRGQARLRTLYRNEGFPDVKVRAAVKREETGLDIKIQIEEGARARVGQIRVVGNRRTRALVILRALTFGANDRVRIIDFQESQKRLYDLGIFRSADVRPDPEQQGRGVQDVLVRVVERPDLDVNYGLRVNAVLSDQSVGSEIEPKANGLEAVARANFVNPFGRGNNLGFSIFFQNNFQLLRGTFRKPTFVKRRIVTELVLESERNEETFNVSDFATKASALTFQQTKKLSDNRYDKFALQWNFRFAKFQSRRFDAARELRRIDTNRPRFGISLIEDRRDSFASPTKGRFWNLTFQGVPALWGSDVGYVRLYGQFFFYKPLASSLVWASGLRIGFAKGTKELLLMEDRFLAGGANSVRGFAQNTLGPSVVISETGERVFVGGQAVSVFNQELRFPIYKALHGGAYWDAGNVFARAKDFSLSDLRHSVGAGLRFVLPFGAIRFDWARVLNVRPGDETRRFHFSVGYAF